MLKSLLAGWNRKECESLRVAVVGLGNLGKRLAEKARKGAEVVGVEPKNVMIEGVEVVRDIEEAEADVYLVALKPGIFRKEMARIAMVAGDRPVVSFAAGVKLAEMNVLENPVRAMTNLAVSLIAVYPKAELNFLEAEIISCQTEDELDSLTSFLGSSPALITRLIDAFIIAALREGVTHDTAKKVAISAFIDAVKLFAEMGSENLVRSVTTPGGTTAEGLLKMPLAEKAFMDALIACSEKARRL